MICMIGTAEILVIGGVILLIFGGKKLPELMKGMGKGVRSFKDGLNNVANPEEEQADKTEDQPEEQNEK